MQIQTVPICRRMEERLKEEEVMMSCPNFEPRFLHSPTMGMQATEDRQKNRSDSLGIMWIYSVTSLSLVSCPLVKVLIGVVFLVVDSVRVII